MAQGFAGSGNIVITGTVNTGNSTTAALLAAATFTGVGFDVSAYPSVVVAALTDQAGTLYIEFSPDNTNWDSSLSFSVAASINEVHRITVTRRYFRVRFTNGGVNQGYLRLQALLGAQTNLTSTLNSTIQSDADALITRSVLVGETINDEYINVPVGLQGQLQVQPIDQFGFTVDSTPNSEMLVTNKIKLVGEIFDGAVIDTNFWTTAVSVGTATEANSELVLTSGTASPNFARIYTPQRANWVSGTTNKFRAQMRIASSDNNVTCRIGVGWGATMPTVTDGAYFKIVGSTISINTMAATVETSVASGSFNGTYVAPTLTNLNVFEILYTLRTVFFLINNVIVHKATYNTTNWTSGTNNFHAFADVVNTGASAAIPYTFRMMNITRLGNMESMPTYKNITGAGTTNFKLGAGHLHSIVINKAGTLCSVFDSTTGVGVSMGIIDTNKNTGTTGTIAYECPFYNGLTLVTTGAGTDITVIYE